MCFQTFSCFVLLECKDNVFFVSMFHVSGFMFHVQVFECLKAERLTGAKACGGQLHSVSLSAF